MASDASKFLWTGHSAVGAEARPPVLQRRTILAGLTKVQFKIDIVRAHDVRAVVCLKRNDRCRKHSSLSQAVKRLLEAAGWRTLILIIIVTAVSAGAAEPKRVLIVHSFGSVAPPFTTHSTAFEAELVKQLGNHVDLDEVSLDMARYAEPDMQQALVDYLEKRGDKWKPNLVVPIGGPAGIFVAKFRNRLFREIPILYCALDRRLLGPEAFDANTVFVGANYEAAGFVEDILSARDEKHRCGHRGDTDRAVLGRGISQGIRAVYESRELHLAERPVFLSNAGARANAASTLLHFSYPLPARCGRCDPKCG